MTEQEAKETNKKVVCEIKIDAGMMRKIIDEKIGQIELDVQEIRNKAIDEFAERLKGKYGCFGYIDEIKFEEVDEIAEQMKAGE